MTTTLQSPPQLHLTSIDHVPALTEKMQTNPVPIALDLETTGLNPRTEKVVTIQFGTQRTVFVLDCRPFSALPLEERQSWCQVLQEFVAACPLVIGHNLKFDWQFLALHFGVKLDHLADTMLREQVIRGVGLGGQEGNGISVNLQATAQRYGFRVQKEERSWFIGLDKHSAWTEPFPKAQLDYIVQDIVAPLQVYAAQQAEFAARGLEHIAALEHACLPAVASMELAGCAVDQERWRGILARKEKERQELACELQAQLTPIMQQHHQEAHAAAQQEFAAWQEAKAQELVRIKGVFEMQVAGMTWAAYKAQALHAWREAHPRPATPKLDTTSVNLGSPVQLKIVLEAVVGHALASTDAAHLQRYAMQYPLIERLLRWKKLEKFITAFGETILNKVEADGRIHPDYRQIGAATGRMSCSTPNWQQLPAHETEENTIRRCVVAAPGNVLLTADFSNIELRILAEMSQDETMLRFFAEGKDLHSETARLMFGLLDDADPKTLELAPGLTYRAVAKTINFGLVYGMSALSLASSLGIEQVKAEVLMQTYFATYPRVAQWLRDSSRQALQQGYSETIAGRKRWYAMPAQMPQYDPEYYAEWSEYLDERREYYKLAGRAERQAKNAPIQGTSADILKCALALLYQHLPKGCSIVACVHDEIVLEVPEEQAKRCGALLAKAMQKACWAYLKTVAVPLPGVSIALYWKKE
jgi:DNA polymerase-1